MENHSTLVVLGALLLVGLVADEIGKRTRLPRVTLLVLFGAAAGPSGFGVLPDGIQDWYEFLASVALTMVAFLLGGSLSLETLHAYGRQILIISASIRLFRIAYCIFKLINFRNLIESPWLLLFET